MGFLDKLFFWRGNVKEEKKLNEAEKKQEKLEEKMAKTVRKDKTRISYRIYRSSPYREAQGWVGTVDAVTLTNYDSVEEFLKMNFGGGTYTLQELKDGVPTGNIMRYTIAGPPIIDMGNPTPRPQMYQWPQYGSDFQQGRPIAPTPEEERLRKRVEELEKQLEEERRQREIEELKNRLIQMEERLKQAQQPNQVGDLAKLIEAVKGKEDSSSSMQLISTLIQATIESQRHTYDRFIELLTSRQAEGGMNNALAMAITGIAELLTGRRQERGGGGQGQQQPLALSGPSETGGSKAQLGLDEMLRVVEEDIRNNAPPNAVAYQLSQIYRMLAETGKPIPPELASIQAIENFVKQRSNEEYAKAVVSFLQPAEEGGENEGTQGVQ